MLSFFFLQNEQTALYMPKRASFVRERQPDTQPQWLVNQ